jgi:hypothetical protein
MAGRANVVRRHHENVYLMPESALLRDGARSYLYLVQGERALRAEVEIVSQSGALAVLSSDLRIAPTSTEATAAQHHDLGSAAAPGELQAIILGQAAVSDGTLLRVRRVHDAPPSTIFD